MSEYRLKEQITSIFEESRHQQEALERIYALFIPDWDKVVLVKGWPMAGREVHLFITQKFMNFDEKYHPEVLTGGLWMNRGFSSSDSLRPWKVDLSTCVISYEEEI